MSECKNCGHSEEDHPNHFMCYAGQNDSSPTSEDCTCPGWVKKVEGVN